MLFVLQVYCDQDTEGGGWIVFQRRKDGSVDFYRNWKDYKAGFGDLEGEFWLGLDKLHHLTASVRNDLRIDLQDLQNNKKYAKYSEFIVGSEGSGYRLTSDGYTGSAGDSFGKGSGSHNGHRFSTKDVDNDDYSTSCADLYKGGWWYDGCHRSNLNGLYLKGDHKSYADGIEWYHWKGFHYSLTFTEMKIREQI